MAINNVHKMMPIDRTDIPQDLAVELQVDLERDFERNGWAYDGDWRYDAWRWRRQQAARVAAKQAADAKR